MSESIIEGIVEKQAEDAKQLALAAEELTRKLQENQSSENTPIICELQSNDFSTIMDEIQVQEQYIESTVKDVDEIAHALKSRIMEYLSNHRERSAILFKGIPEILGVQASLFSTSIAGRARIASLKKIRADVIAKKNISGSDDFDLMKLLSE